jgi:hypothetical protein
LGFRDFEANFSKH